MRVLLAILALLLIIGLAGSASTAAESSGFRVITHSSNPEDSFRKEFVARAFLKKVSRWPRGETIQPVDLLPKSPVRSAFSEQILDRSVQAVRSYWQRILFSGRDVPPPQLKTDQEVLSYVARHAGSIGYISTDGKLDLRGVKVVEVRGQ